MGHEKKVFFEQLLPGDLPGIESLQGSGPEVCPAVSQVMCGSQVKSRLGLERLSYSDYQHSLLLSLHIQRSASFPSSLVPLLTVFMRCGFMAADGKEGNNLTAEKEASCEEYVTVLKVLSNPLLLLISTATL